MNAAVHTSTSVHRCRGDIPGTSAIYLTIPRGPDDAFTLSPPLVLADAYGDAAVAAGMASAIPASSAPATFGFMVSPGIAGNAHDRGAAPPSNPRKYGPGYWPAGGVNP